MILFDLDTEFPCVLVNDLFFILFYPINNPDPLYKGGQRGTIKIMNGKKEV
jgi:hypothetical protein